MPQTFRAVSVTRHEPGALPVPFAHATLLHDERRVRRRVIRLAEGDDVLVDFVQPVTLAAGDCLKLEDGRLVEIRAAEEKLFDIRGRDITHLMQLAWHLGNRHTKTEICTGPDGTADRILILRDHVLRDMLRGLGAKVTDVVEPFSPMDGAYAHDHGHALLNR
ncbi:urease accessory protein UreE [Devosia sp.]|uniref:urease accessory protein UreE n=1 Tax=Devosia sp. TaxID=1871048 RepID=UPI003A905C21